MPSQALVSVFLLLVTLTSQLAAQTTVTNCTECDAFASCTANSTSFICECDGDFEGNGTHCEYRAKLHCSNDVTKDGYGMRIRLNQTYIDSLGIDPSDLRLLNGTCNATLQSGYYVIETADFDSCGSVASVGTGTTQYTNVVSSDDGISSGPNIAIGVTCNVGSLIKISLSDGNSTYGINVSAIAQDKIYLPAISGRGTISASMYLFKDAAYSSAYNGVPVLTTTDSIYIKIALDTQLTGIYTRAERCWATPEATGTEDGYGIIDNPGCMKSSIAGGSVTSNGDSEEVKFQFQLFTYVQTNIVYIHCEVELCKPSGVGTCAPTCSSRRRRKRDTNTETRILRSSLIIRSNEVIDVLPEKPTNIFNTSSEVFHIVIIMIVVGVVLLITCIALIVYLCVTRRRK